MLIKNTKDFIKTLSFGWDEVKYMREFFWIKRESEELKDSVENLFVEEFLRFMENFRVEQSNCEGFVRYLNGSYKGRKQFERKG